MNRLYSLLFFLLTGAALLIGGIVATSASSVSLPDSVSRSPQTVPDVLETNTDRVNAKKPSLPTIGPTDGKTKTFAQVEPLDRESIYERASKSPTKMLPTDESLDLFQKRILDNPSDYASWMVLGRLYLRRADEQGDFHDLIHAEQSFDSSLTINPKHIGALTFKAIAQNQQHKFKAAYETASKALKLKPGNFTALAEMGDAQLQLGNLDNANQLYLKLHEVAETPGSFARLARLAELRGDLGAAETELNHAIEKAKEFSQKPEDIAWYHWRLAELAWNQNQLDKCLAELNKSLAASPEDAATLISRAKLHCAQGEVDTAIHSILTLVERDPAPPTLALLGDLYSVSGDSGNAEKYWDLADEAMAEEATYAGEAHLRERAMFLLDHDKEIASALEMTVADFRNRTDIYAYDAAAWAYFKNGQLNEATQAIEQALSTGSQDPLLQFHAMQIYAANQDLDAAKTAAAKLESANPNFHPRLAIQAREVITTL